MTDLAPESQTDRIVRLALARDRRAVLAIIEEATHDDLPRSVDLAIADGVTAYYAARFASLTRDRDRYCRAWEQVGDRFRDLVNETRWFASKATIYRAFREAFGDET